MPSANIQYSDIRNTAAIIVTYNPDINLLNKCLSRLHGIGKIQIFDNQSSNLCQIYTLKRLYPALSILESSYNIGLAKAQNLACKSNSTYKFFLFLDQDSVPSLNYLEDLVTFSQQNNIDFSQNVLTPICIDSSSGLMYPLVFLDQFRGTRHVREIQPDQEMYFPDILISSGTFISVESFFRSGGFIDSFFIDYIDTEWSLRLKSIGLLIVASPKIYLMHRIGDVKIDFFGRSVPVDSPIRKFYRLRNLLLMTYLPHVPKVLIIVQITKMLLVSVVNIFHLKSSLLLELAILCKALLASARLLCKSQDLKPHFES